MIFNFGPIGTEKQEELYTIAHQTKRKAYALFRNNVKRIITFKLKTIFFLFTEDFHAAMFETQVLKGELSLFNFSKRKRL